MNTLTPHALVITTARRALGTQMVGLTDTGTLRVRHAGEGWRNATPDECALVTQMVRQ